MLLNVELDDDCAVALSYDGDESEQSETKMEQVDDPSQLLNLGFFW